MKIGISLLGAALLIGALLTPAASAQTRPSFTLLAGCEITLEEWPTTSTTRSEDDCDVGSTSIPNNWPTDGIAIGLATAGTAPTACVPSCSFAAVDIDYSEACTAPVLPPAIGLATGRLVVDGADAGGFIWTRVGLEAVVITTELGVGAATFYPDATGGPIGGCPPAIPADLTAHIVGILRTRPAP